MGHRLGAALQHRLAVPGLAARIGVRVRRSGFQAVTAEPGVSGHLPDVVDSPLAGMSEEPPLTGSLASLLPAKLA